MLSPLYHRSLLLAAAIVAAANLVPADTIRADEPTIVSVALLFDVGNIDDISLCLDDAVGIVFDGPSGGSSSTKTLEGNPAFGEFSGQNLLSVGAQYVQKGEVIRGVVWGFENALPPAHGMMPVGPNSDVAVKFCGLVSDNGGTLETDELGELLLVIVTGPVYGCDSRSPTVDHLAMRSRIAGR